ncbi:DUF2690 domain-containing protein [Micromonospora chalcea]
MVKSQLVRMLAALLLGTGLAAVVPQAANANACTDFCYDGKDPVTLGCGNTSTKHAAPIQVSGTTIGIIELRYSSTCRTAWGRIQIWKAEWEKGAIPWAYGQVVRNSSTYPANYRCTRLAWSSVTSSYTCYTPMVNDKNLVSFANAELQYYNATGIYAQTAEY